MVFISEPIEPTFRLASEGYKHLASHLFRTLLHTLTAMKSHSTDKSGSVSVTASDFRGTQDVEESSRDGIQIARRSYAIRDRFLSSVAAKKPNVGKGGRKVGRVGCRRKELRKKKLSSAEFQCATHHEFVSLPPVIAHCLRLQ